jgi:hypothetical protein
MDRSEVIRGVLDMADSIGKRLPSNELNGTVWVQLRSLAIVGALHEHETARRVDMVSEIFDRLRSTGVPVGEPAGAEATDREEVDAGLEVALPPEDGVSTSAPAVEQGGPMADGVYLVDSGPSDEEAKPAPPDVGAAAPAPPAAEPFACVCGKTFVNTQGLGRHRTFCAALVDTRRPAPARRRPPAEPLGEHPCEFCGKVWPSIAALRGHLNYCKKAKAARLARRLGATRVPDPPAAVLGPPDPITGTADQLGPGLVLLCSCGFPTRNASVLNSHTHKAHDRTPTRDERTPQRAEVSA